MNNCWAESLGDCDGGISREHIVSESLFVSSYVDVKGFEWCKEETERIGLASLTKKVLCRRHNSQLSKIDSAAAHAFDILRRQTKLSNDRGKQPEKKYKKITFSINALALEQWPLKTLINICFGEKYFIGPTSSQQGRPSDELVKIVFGKDRFGAKNGMYVAAKAGGTLNFTDTISFSPLLKDNSHIYGGRFSFRGVYMFLDLSPEGLSVPFHQIPGIEYEWHHINLMRPFKQVNAALGNRISHVVKFNW